MKKVQLFTILLLLVSAGSFAQLAGWTYRMPLTINETSGNTQTNYQVRLSINTAALIGAGHMDASGNDIRFGDSCSTNIYQHYVESGMNTTNTLIWVKLPSLPANGSVVVYLYYGNASASNSASFAGTFPNAFISGGPNTTMSGTVTYDWFQVDVNDTVFTSAGTALTINARNVIINGVISGNGRGYQAPAINTAGTGPGGGGTSANSGCGGGSYGGVGGTGGMDAGDTPGTGGAAYGTASGTDLDMGSSGGSGTGASFNGHGGGAVTVNADYLMVNGAVLMNGASPTSDGTGRGAGGGAGGGVMLNGYDISITGTINTNGGNGATGTSAANDSGGGGGGGRVKVFTSGSLTNTGTVTASFGTGGPNGTAAPGQPGTAGSTNFGTGTFAIPGFSSGAEANIAAPTYTVSNTSICIGDAVVLTAASGYSSYSFIQNNVVVNTSSSSTYTFTNLASGDSITVAANLSSCLMSTAAATTIIVNASPVAGTASAVSDSICAGSSATLQTSGSLGIIEWFEVAGTTYTSAGFGTPLITPALNTPGTIQFAAVSNNGGCPADTSALVTVIVDALPVAGTASSTASTGMLCAGDSILFSTAGSTGTIEWVVQFNGSGPFSGFGNGNPFSPGSPSNQDTGMYVFAAVASTGNACPSDTSNTFTITVKPSPVVALGSDTVICGNTMLLDAGNPGSMFLWSNGDTTQSITAGSSGTYTVDVNWINGCSTSDTIQLTINTPPVAALGTDISQCGGTVTLNAGNAGDTYLWNNNDTTQSIIVSSSGVYSVLISSGPGCTDSDTISVTINTPPTVTLNIATATICVDDASFTLSGGNPGGGTFSGPGVSSGSFSPVTAGIGTHTITYSYTDVNGCSASATDQLTVSACAGINELGEADAVIVYPNPGNGEFNLTIQLALEELQINVTDLQGRVVYSEQAGTVAKGFSKQLPLGTLADGVYFLQLQSGKSSRVEKLVIRK